MAGVHARSLSGRLSEVLHPGSKSAPRIVLALSGDSATVTSAGRGDLVVVPPDTAGWLGGCVLSGAALLAEGETGEGSDRVAAAAAAEAADSEATAGGARSHAVSREAAADSHHGQRLSLHDSHCYCA